MLSGWEGHILSFLSITARLANCGCMLKRADSGVFFCVSHTTLLSESLGEAHVRLLHPQKIGLLSLQPSNVNVGGKNKPTTR